MNLLAGLLTRGGPRLLGLMAATGDLVIDRNLAYGPDPRHSLDLYRPRRGNGRLLAFFPGGGWDSGSKAGYLFAIRPFLDAGYTVAVPDYRLHPRVSFPAFIEDGALALRFLLERADEHGVDALRFYLAGHSAGAYNAALLALDAHYLRAVGIDAQRIAAVIGLAGPYDFSTRSKDLAPIFAGAPDDSTQPVRLVAAEAPPMFLAAGDADRTVHPRNSRHLAERLRQAGVTAELKIYPGLGHIGIVAALAPPLRRRAPVAQDAVDFLMRH